MTVWSWAEFTELQSLMQPGEAELDPLEQAERSGCPLDELAETRRAWTAGNSAAGECVDCGRYQQTRYVARCSRCYKRLSKP